MSTEPVARPTGAIVLRSWGDRLQRTLMRILIYSGLIIMACISLFPLYWLFVTAVTPASATLKLPPQLIPTNPTLENITNLIRISGKGSLTIAGLEAIQMPRLLLWFVNTLLIGLISTAIHVLFDTMAGYAFAKRKFPGSNFLFWMILAALMIPGQVTLVPLYIMITKLKLVNTFAGVLLPGLADVIGIFLLKQYIQTMPGELEEAARIDGASEWQTFARIIVPLAAPGMAVIAIFSFQRYWNAFLWPLVILQNPDLFTVQVGLSYLYNSEFGTNYGLLMSGAALASIPMIIFFFAFQRYFMQGLRVGAIKG